MFLSSCITHKAISAPLVAAVAVAVAPVAVVAVAAPAAAAAKVEVAAAELAVAVKAKAAIAITLTPTGLMRFRLRYLNFVDFSFHYSLEIIFRNLNNSFLQAIFLYKRHFDFRNNKCRYKWK